jgi:hypothetical protein
MLRMPASIVILAVLLISCADPLFCADGCDRAEQHHATAPVACGACVTCQSGLISQYRPFQDPSLTVTAVTPRAERSAYSIQQDSIDHPPRIA